MNSIVAAVNPLSLSGQANSQAEANELLVRLVACLTALLPLLQRKTATLLFDPSSEHENLSPQEPLISTLNHVHNKDITKKWFIYTRNRASKAGDPWLDVKLSAAGESIEGIVSDRIFSEAKFLVSFGGRVISDAPLVTIERLADGNVSTKNNASSVEGVERWLPKYEASEKHRLEPYELNGELVSPMDLFGSNAQGVLLSSLPSGERRRFALVNEAYYEFRLTRVDGTQSIYHGFKIDLEMVPQDLLSSLRNAG